MILVILFIEVYKINYLLIIEELKKLYYKCLNLLYDL